MSRVHGFVLGMVCFGIVGPAASSAPRANPAPPAPVAVPTASREGMVLVPAGSFDMGSNNGGSDEKPVHSVSVSAFWMDVTEVTANAYAACVKEGGCSADELKCGDATAYGITGKGNHPINCVDWNHATAFCRRARQAEARPTGKAQCSAATHSAQLRSYPGNR